MREKCNLKKNRQTTKFILILLTITVVLFLSGCLGENIGDILKNPREYDQKTVHIKGKVIEVYSDISHRGSYEIDDGTGSIWVRTNSVSTSKGEEVSVTGKVSTDLRFDNPQIVEETRS